VRSANISARIPAARINWSSDIETILGGANRRSHESVIRRGRTLTPGRARFAFGARQRTACLGTRTSPMPADFSIPNKSPFRTVPLTLKLENGGVKAVGVLKLDEAARRLGCHVETLRVHIRDGRLRAVRGPHGAYYPDARTSIDTPDRSGAGQSLESFRSASWASHGLSSKEHCPRRWLGAIESLN
jgi:excisionase family DNA binding protein